jgi:predicted glycoside hydrolase/deacetylase ChbG (UPF0249 family)
MANGPAFEQAVGLAKENPRLGVGCHLVAIGAEPMREVSVLGPLVGGDGRFPPTLREFLRLHPGCFFSNWRHSKILAQEFAAQVDRLLLAGLSVSHLDTHKHLHALPGIREAVFQVARNKKIPFVRFPFEPGVGLWNLMGATSNMPLGPWRRRAAVSFIRWLWANDFRRRLSQLGLKSADATFGIVHTGCLTPQVIEGFLSQQHEVIEICCHPGYDEFRIAIAGETLGKRRENEVVTLTDLGWKARLAERGIELTNYAQLSID